MIIKALYLFYWRFIKLRIVLGVVDGLYKEGKYGTGNSALYFSDFKVKEGKVSNELVVSGPFVWSQNKLDEEIKKYQQF